MVTLMGPNSPYHPVVIGSKSGRDRVKIGSSAVENGYEESRGDNDSDGNDNSSNENNTPTTEVNHVFSLFVHQELF